MRWRGTGGLLLAFFAAFLVVLGACGGGTAAPDRSDDRLEGWHYQLSGPPPGDLDVLFAVLDLDDAPRSRVAELSSGGTTTICYVSAGTVEAWRADADQLPSDVVGAPLADWPDERWLDTRRTDVLLPVMEQRLERCRGRGFDGVELDNVDGHANETGFALRDADQVGYVRALTRRAHELGLQVALKNAGDLVPELVDDVDLAIVEECLQYSECEAYDPIVEAGKPVLAVEYTGDPDELCPRLHEHGFLGLVSERALDGGGVRCPASS